MKLVTTNLRCAPDINFDEIMKPIHSLLLITNSLSGIREIWVRISNSDWAIATVDSDGVRHSWFVCGYLCKSHNSYFKWDFDSWFTNEIPDSWFTE